MPDTTSAIPVEELTAREKRDLKRGYSIDRKYVGIAFLAEGAVIATSLFGAWLFASKYGGGDESNFYMLLLAPLSYAVIELCRVPLAIAVRVQRNYLVKILAIIGVMAAAVVTAKSMSQLGEIMFRPRLIEVRNSQRDLDSAQSNLADFEKIRSEHEAEVTRLTQEAKVASDTLNAQSANLKATKDVCVQQSRRERNGTTRRWTTCSPPPEKRAFLTTTTTSSDALQSANTRLGEANTRLAALGNAQERSQAVVRAKARFDDAVLNSQLHAFTGMMFGRDPAEVTDGEISQFLRLFVLLPAICVSLASTILALASVHRIKPKKAPSVPPQGVPLPAGAGHYVLGPYAQEVYKNAVAAAEKVAQDALKKNQAKPAPNVTPIKAVGEK